MAGRAPLFCLAKRVLQTTHHTIVKPCQTYTHPAILSRDRRHSFLGAGVGCPTYLLPPDHDAHLSLSRDGQVS